VIAWILIVIVIVIVAFAVFALLAWLDEDAAYERARIEMEVMRAERRLHDVASSAFQAMLDEARGHDQGRR
jgi:flagellar basal body-associated protein FliL